MDKPKSLPDKNELTDKHAVKEGNTCIGLGIGVGALGAGSAILSGAVCPLCYVVAPALIGVGIIRRRQGRPR